MFQARSALFLYAVSPVHMGAGTALGLIDNPIQREIHTGHPVFAGSGIKGAIRHQFQASDGKNQDTNRIFGPEPGQAESGHAGAISISDGQLLAFPVRSLTGGFVYATSGDTLARARRRLNSAGVTADFGIPQVEPGKALIAEDHLLNNGKLVLETWQYTAEADPTLAETAQWLAKHAFPPGPGFEHFESKFSRELVVLPEEDFAHFAEHACLVEPHVRIAKETGTASDGGLFYTENLPPEALLLAVAMATNERSSQKNGEGLSAGQVMEAVTRQFDGRMLQIGGDATTGRGQVVLRFVGGEQQ